MSEARRQLAPVLPFHRAQPIRVTLPTVNDGDRSPAVARALVALLVAVHARDLAGTVDAASDLAA